ncbi:MAG: hypothetical protein LPK45_01340 [Bacteroidota bacterium]|nr:hypothetical protein [Bacteroidota bacterium]MDX5429679.1 hypothetical protein [Bacteroidota bacterium]MDX5468457.1 hypothetical protein [Bacteroidota bacterium]
MKRENLFIPPHKALRKMLGNVSLMAGQLEPGNVQQIDALKLMGEELFFLLDTHATSEEEFVLSALEEKVPGASKANHEEHEMLEAQQADVQSMMRALNEHSTEEDCYQFYLAFSSYHSAYLLHIIHEEKETNQLLWDHFTDEELVGIRIRLVQHLAFDDYLTWLKHFFTSMSDTEIAGMMTGMKMGMPEEPFKRVLDTFETSVSRVRADKILASMNHKLATA